MDDMWVFTDEEKGIHIAVIPWVAAMNDTELDKWRQDLWDRWTWSDDDPEIRRLAEYMDGVADSRERQTRMIRELTDGIERRHRDGWKK